MKILVVGSGGREHALGWALRQGDPQVDLAFAPGNAGTAALGTNVPLRADDVKGIVRYARHADVDIVVVGPEVPLVLGLVDALEAEGIGAVGPTAAAARLEGSKAYSKDFMQRYGIATAASRTFGRSEFDDAHAYVARQREGPLVVKASGLAAGKGAVVCDSRQDALVTLDQMLRGHTFGDAADEVVVEAFMEGEEASIFALTDGEPLRAARPRAGSQAHRRGRHGPQHGRHGRVRPGSCGHGCAAHDRLP